MVDHHAGRDSWRKPPSPRAEPPPLPPAAARQGGGGGDLGGGNGLGGGGLGGSGAKAGYDAAMRAATSPGYVCRVCTLENPAGAAECAACGTAAADAFPAAAAAAAAGGGGRHKPSKSGLGTWGRH